MSTANTMRPALQVIKMQPGFGLISSVFFMMLRDKVYVYADCAINVDPSAEELAALPPPLLATTRRQQGALAGVYRGGGSRYDGAMALAARPPADMCLPC